MIERNDRQEKIHEALQPLVCDEDDADDVLTGWIIVYEAASPEGRAYAGHFYGPSGMTTWRALGLAEWAARHTLNPGEDDDDDDD